MMTDKIIQELKLKGYRITPQRKIMIATLVQSDRALSAAEVYDFVRQECPQVSLDTVYRNINVLVQIGVLMPISGLGNDSVKYEFNDNHHHHIVCVDCGRIQCLDFCPVDRHLANMIADKGYQLISHNMELYGLCETCQNIRRQHGQD